MATFKIRSINIIINNYSANILSYFNHLTRVRKSIYKTTALQKFLHADEANSNNASNDATAEITMPRLLFFKQTDESTSRSVIQ